MQVKLYKMNCYTTLKCLQVPSAVTDSTPVLIKGIC
jgi:hypothetical protein